MKIYDFTYEIFAEIITITSIVVLLVVPELLFLILITIGVSFYLLIKSIETERKFQESEKFRLKEQLRTQKLEALGTLTGGIAHDFNNILTPLIGNIDLLEIEINPDKNDEISEIIKDLKYASKNASKLVEQLLNYSRASKPEIKTIHINKILKQAAEFILSGSRSKVEFDFVGKNIVEVDPNKITQVINNLVINADQSMDNGGIIRIKAKTIMVHQEEKPNIKNGKYVKISVKDSGKGIPTEIHSRIFTPYFTTKKTGFGLGLANSFAIIKSHKGYINFESKVGVGTTFYIYLPISKSIKKKH